MATIRSQPNGASGSTVSVALCTYNSSRYIATQLVSILEQDSPPLEVVVCDDGSSDDTLAIVRRVASEHAGATTVRIAETSRVGSAALNFERAVGHCTGDFVALSDHDDKWSSRRLSAAVAVARAAKPPALVFSDARLVDGDGAPTGRSLFGAYGIGAPELDPVAQGHAFEVLMRRNIITGATVLFDRTLLEAAAPFGRSWVHDEWLAILCSALGSVTCIEEPLIDYRIHGANQIGVPPRSPFRRLWLALWPGNSRFITLKTRSAELAARLESLEVERRFVEAARRRLAFEDARREYAWLFLLRGRAILRQWRAGSYREFERWPRLEAWRDYLQRF